MLSNVLMHIYKRRSLESVYSWELCLQTVCCRRPFHRHPHGCCVKPPHDTPGRAAPSGPSEASMPCWGGYSPFSCPCEQMPGTPPPPAAYRGSRLSRVVSRVLCVLMWRGPQAGRSVGWGLGTIPMKAARPKTVPGASLWAHLLW